MNVDRHTDRRSLAEQIGELGPEFSAAWAKVPEYLRIQFPSMSDEDVHDVAVDSMLAVISASSRTPGGGTNIRYPQAYLRQVATRTAYRKIYRRNAQQSLAIDELSPVLSDEAAAVAFDSTATALDIRIFMGQLANSGDSTSYKILSYIIDIIYVEGSSPTTREVARECGISHTGVSKSIGRIRERFIEFYIAEQ